MSEPMKTFTYKSEEYIRVYPAPKLYNSMTIRNITNRGDIFAVRLSDMKLTIVPGSKVAGVEVKRLHRVAGSKPAQQLLLKLF